MKPNVGDRTDIGPPLNCAKTGTPTNPSIMYTNMENAPSLLPKTRPANTAKKVCNVIGTPPTANPGMMLVILAPIAVRATNKLPSVKLSGVNLFFIFWGGGRGGGGGGGWVGCGVVMVEYHKIFRNTICS